MLAKRNQAPRGPNIWPGFVDAISTLLLVLIFLLVVFVLAQFFLSHALTGRDEALSRLNQQVAELADLLALEESASTGLREDIAQLGTQLQASNKDRETLNRQLFIALGENSEMGAEINSLQLAQAATEASEEDISLRLSAALTALAAEKLALKTSHNKLTSGELLLTKQKELSSAAQRQVALLNQQVAALRIQLSKIQSVLEVVETNLQEKNVQVVDLGKRLNAALADKVGELSRYRSEFFGRLRESLSERSEVSIEGDRFVIQSGVLFASSSAELDPEGKMQLADLAKLLLKISGDIPRDIEWVLRIDGHTDKRPINTSQFPSNWELSAARAISVARHLTNEGVPPARLMAAGFGEFQPIINSDDEQAYRRNRRIEFKLTER
jgi:chemotaxis protein MotB